MEYSQTIKVLIPKQAHDALGDMERGLEQLYEYESNQVIKDQPKLPEIKKLIRDSVEYGFYSSLKGVDFDKMTEISAGFDDRYNEGRRNAMAK